MIDLIGSICDRLTKEIAQKNRQVLAGVTNWISDDTYASSVAKYGIREELRGILDLPVGEFTTYTDAILRLSGFLKNPVMYLEIGVSVGKNFLQAASFFENSTLVGLDIEPINPVLERHFGGIRSADNGLTEYYQSQNKNSIFYLRGDLRDENTWRALAGRSFNVIFSDAVHSPQWITHEHEMITRYGLRDREEFVLVWDDLAGPMQEAFDRIWFDLEREGAQRHLVPLNGWLVVNEPPHMVGFITRL